MQNITAENGKVNSDFNRETRYMSRTVAPASIML